MKYYLFIVLLFISGSIAYSQNHNTAYEIIITVVENTKIPIVDTLAPPSYSKLLIDQIKEKINLTRAEKKLLKGTKIQGLLIDRGRLPNFKFYKHDSIVQAFRILDVNSIKYLEDKKPFYFISYPIIFPDQSTAIISMDLIGGFGVLYILKKKNGKWTIVDSIGRWYS